MPPTFVQTLSLLLVLVAAAVGAVCFGLNRSRTPQRTSSALVKTEAQHLRPLMCLAPLQYVCSTTQTRCTP